MGGGGRIRDVVVSFWNMSHVCNFFKTLFYFILFLFMHVVDVVVYACSSHFIGDRMLVTRKKSILDYA